MPKVIGTIDVSFSSSSLVQGLVRYAQTVPEAANHAIRVVAKELLKDSRLYVPVLTGELLKSGRVEELPSLEDAVKVARVVYGSANVVYAKIQHEKPFNHPSLGFFGPAKFLEKPLVDNGEFYQVLLATEYELFLLSKY